MNPWMMWLSGLMMGYCIGYFVSKLIYDRG